MYLSYEEYVSFGGSLSSCEYNHIIIDIEYTIDYYTFNRLKNETTIPESVKLCIYKLVNLFYRFNRYQEVLTNLSNPVVTSQSNDGVSTTYGGYAGNTSPLDLDQYQKQFNVDVKNTIRKYLIHTYNSKKELLLYKGIR